MVKSPMSDVELVEVSLHQAAFQMMEALGDEVAIIDGVTERQYSFREVVDTIKRLASSLVRTGLAKGDVVALLSQNSPEFVFMFFATLACGATVTPINPSYTVYEVNKQLEDSRARFIYGTKETIKTAMAAGKKTGKSMTYIAKEGFPYCLSLNQLMMDDGSLFPNDLDIDPKNDVAVIPYSSGTTGVPKGVMITHYNIMSQFAQLSHPDFVKEDVDPEAKNVVLVFLPLFHVYGMFAGMVGSLIKGATQVIMPRFHPERFLQLIEKYKVSYVPSVPPVIIFLTNSPLVKKYDLSSIRNFGSGGAPLSKDTEADFLNRVPVPEVSQGFGMTETTLCVTSPAAYRPLRPGSIGVPIANCEMQVVDPATKAVLGPGERGEIWVRGPNIMKGYLNRPEATRDTLDDQGWLHTGDVGYYDRDSYFYIVDRIKELIKYKAFQVAPAELEALLLTHPDIVDAAVIGIPDKSAGELPRAYVVKAPGAQTTDEDVKKFVADHVSSFKHLRGGVEFVDVIPKSQSGKILRRQLKDTFTKSRL